MKKTLSRKLIPVPFQLIFQTVSFDLPEVIDWIINGLRNWVTKKKKLENQIFGKNFFIFIFWPIIL